MEAQLDTPFHRRKRENIQGCLIPNPLRADGLPSPGKLTIPEQIESDKQPYYKALEAADDAWSEGTIDISEMKKLVSSMLGTQLLGIFSDSESGDDQ